jgi:hypothetical protein
LSILWVYGLNVLRLFLLISYKLTLLFVLFAMIEARTYKISFYVINLSIKGLFWINRSLMTFEYLGLGLKLSRMIHAIYNLFLLFDALLYFNLLFFIYFCQWFDEIGFVISISFLDCCRVLDKIQLKTIIWSLIFLFEMRVFGLWARLGILFHVTGWSLFKI